MNGDDAAAAIAVALGAEELLLVADVPGVMRDGAVIPRSTPDEARQLIDDGTAVGGMQRQAAGRPVGARRRRAARPHLGHRGDRRSIARHRLCSHWRTCRMTASTIESDDRCAASSRSTRRAATAATQSPRSRARLLGNYKRAPVEFVRGSGVYLFDADGKRYLDFVSGIAVNALGYGDPGLKARAARRRGRSRSTCRTSTRRRPASGSPRRSSTQSFADKVFFCNSGAEANEGAFKFARRWARTQGDAKHEIVALRGAFHGRLFGTLAATDRPSYRIPFRPLAPGISIVERDIEDLAVALNAETAAALILEPVQGEGGVRVLDAGFVRELRALTQRARRRAHLRRDPVRPRPHGNAVRLRAVRRRAGHADAREADRRRAADGRDSHDGGDRVDDQAGRSRHHVRRRPVRRVGRELTCFERLSDPALLAHVRENGAWFGKQLERDRASHGPHPCRCAAWATCGAST